MDTLSYKSSTLILNTPRGSEFIGYIYRHRTTKATEWTRQETRAPRLHIPWFVVIVHKV
jgi:hypothetical protein